jgi:hypothetical protein
MLVNTMDVTGSSTSVRCHLPSPSRLPPSMYEAVRFGMRSPRSGTVSSAKRERRLFLSSFLLALVGLWLISYVESLPDDKRTTGPTEDVL